MLTGVPAADLRLSTNLQELKHLSGNSLTPQRWRHGRRHLTYTLHTADLSV